MTEAAYATFAAATARTSGDIGDGGVFVMSDGSRAYLGLRHDDHSVVVIDMKTLEIESRFAMGVYSGPGCINWAALVFTGRPAFAQPGRV